MNLKSFIIGAIFFGVIGSTASAQDTTYTLQPALVDLRADAGLLTYELDDLETDATNMANSISRRLPLNLKSNSGSALTSISLRGGTPEQSTIYWNGISLQNNTNGVIDLQLLPSIFFDRIELNGIHSTSRGSGSISGSMNLANVGFKSDSQSHISLQLGSFGALQTSGVVRYGKSRIAHQTRFVISRAENDYPYESVSFPIDGKLDTLNNAAAKQFGILHQTTISTPKRSPVNIRLWYQNNFREIPATMLEAGSIQAQSDESVRLQSDWSHNVGKTWLKINAALFREGLVYRDRDTFSYVSSTAVITAHAKKKFGDRHYVGADVEVRSFSADADTFYNRSRQEFSFAIHDRYQINRWLFNGGLRYAGYNSVVNSPLLYSLKATYSPSSRVKLSTRVHSNYRVPTFNNLHWRPGGNSELIPEKSHVQEFQFSVDLNSVFLAANVYSNLILNQIQWLPSSSGYFEAVQDKDKRQWNRGVETSAKYSNNNTFFKVSINYVRSGKWNLNHRPEQLQQIFTPNFQGNAEIGYRAKKISASIFTTFIGKRYISTDNKETLPEILLIGARTQYQIKSLMLYLIVENAMDLQYVILPYRPMFPRRLKMGIQWNFNTIKEHKENK